MFFIAPPAPAANDPIREIGSWIEQIWGRLEVIYEFVRPPIDFARQLVGQLSETIKGPDPRRQPSEDEGPIPPHEKKAPPRETDDEP